MDLNTKVISETTTSKVWELTLGQIFENMKESGCQTRCTERVNSPGQMADSTKESISMTQKTVLEPSHGRMDVDT